MHYAKTDGPIVSAYHRLVEPQVDLFLSVASDTCNKITMAGSERYYSPCDYLTPGTETLKALIGELRCRTGDHPIVLDSGGGYWKGGALSGLICQYGATTCNASYLLTDLVGDSKTYCQKIRDEDRGGNITGIQAPRRPADLALETKQMLTVSPQPPRELRLRVSACGAGAEEVKSSMGP